MLWRSLDQKFLFLKIIQKHLHLKLLPTYNCNNLRHILLEKCERRLKIFIVAMCWTLLTAVYPLIDLVSWNFTHYLFFLERFILVFIATLPFEIRDAAMDQKELGTIPQLIGESKTRWLGVALLFLLFGMELLIPKGANASPTAFILMGTAYLCALFVVKKESSENITLFWVELIPAIGWLYYFIKTL